jgi:single-strand DNA-binding protein
MTNRYEATGEIRAIMDTQQVTDSFRKREFALEIEDGRYPQTVKFQLVQDKTELLDDFEEGQQVRVHFNLRGREYTRKSDGATDYWTNLECWRIETVKGAEDQAHQSPSGADEPAASSFGTESDDIPF